MIFVYENGHQHELVFCSFASKYEKQTKGYDSRKDKGVVTICIYI